MAKYIQKAIDRLHLAYETGLAAQLRDVETQEGIAVDSLTDPVDFLKVFHPNDNRSPLIMIDDVGAAYADAAGQRNRIMGVDCGVLFSFRAGIDREAGKLFIRRYVTAMVQVIEADPILGGNEAAIIGRIDTATDDSKISGQDESSSKFYVLMEVSVRVHSP